MKIAVEIILGIISLILGNIFWSALRAGSFQKKLIQNEDEIKKLITYITPEKFINESHNVEPAMGSYSNNIGVFLYSSIETFKRTRNIILLIQIIILVVCYFIKPVFIPINLFLFILIGLSGINNYVKNSVATDIHSVMSNIYKWNLVDTKECEKFCISEKPYLKTLYLVVSNLK